MEEFVAKHILGIFLTQLAIGISAIVKLWFNFQTLKRDFEKKEKTDKELIDKEEKKLEQKLDKIEVKIDLLQSSIEATKKEVHETDKSLTEQMLLLKAQTDVYGKMSSSLLEHLVKTPNLNG